LRACNILGSQGLPPGLPMPERSEDQHRAKDVSVEREEQHGSPGGTRTPDKAVNSRLLYQLSYRGRGAPV
jgi:hypothetical protein